MKVTINVDCTPEEARVFLGLPDVQPMQKALMDQLQERMSNSLAAMDPETLMKTWLPVGMQNFEQLQRFFWAQMGRSPSSSGSSGSGGSGSSGGTGSGGSGGSGGDDKSD
jgi:uncharacterized membrane protein YgcG